MGVYWSGDDRTGEEQRGRKLMDSCAGDAMDMYCSRVRSRHSTFRVGVQQVNACDGDLT